MSEQEMMNLIEKMESNEVSESELKKIREQVDRLASKANQDELETTFMAGWVLTESLIIQKEAPQLHSDLTQK